MKLVNKIFFWKILLVMIFLNILLTSAAHKRKTNDSTNIRHSTSFDKKLTAENTSIHILFIHQFKDEWNSSEGPIVSKFSSAWVITCTYFFLGAIVMIVIFSDIWWKGLLILLFMILFFIFYFKLLKVSREIEYEYNRGRKNINWVPLIFPLYGAYAAILGDMSPSTWDNLGYFVPTGGHSGFFTTLTITMSWIILVSLIYAIIVIIRSSANRKIAFSRLFSLLFICLFGFIIGVTGSLIIAIIIALTIFKGIALTPSESISSNSSSNTKKVECSHKTISGGCDLNNGWGCKVEDGAGSCPYGLRNS